MDLSTLKNSVQKKSSNRVGRGPSSGNGKTSGRGHKGAGSRSGYKRRYGCEGGQLPLYRKLPTRGFSNARFAKRIVTVNFSQLNKIFKDGELVSEQTLRNHGLFSGKCSGVKILADGNLDVKVMFEVNAVSKQAAKVIEEKKLELKLLHSK